MFLWLSDLLFLLFRILLGLYDFNRRLYFLCHFGKQLLPGQGNLLSFKLQFQNPLANLPYFGLQNRIGQGISQPLLELLLLKRNGLTLIDFVEIYCDLRDPVEQNAAIVGIDNKQPPVIVELATEW